MKPVTVAYLPTASNSPLFLAMQRGFFHDEGPEVTTENTSALMIPFAVVSAQADFGYASVPVVLGSKANRMPLRVVGAGGTWSSEPSGSPFAVMVREGSTIKAPADLEGARAVDTLFSLPHLSLLVTAGTLGLRIGRRKAVEMPFAAMPAALAAGEVDAADLGEPYLTEERERGSRPVLANSVGFEPGTSQGLWVTSDRFADDDPSAVAAFQAAMRRATALAESAPEAARAQLPDYTSTAPELASRVAMPLFTNRVDRRNFDVYAATMRAMGLLRPDFDIGPLLSRWGIA